MDLKLEETWVSTILLNYGKEIMIEGNFMPMAIKKICRTYAETSHAYPSLKNQISSIFTSTFAATTKGYDPYVPYLIALLVTLNLIEKEFNFSSTLGNKLQKLRINNKIDINHELKLFFLILPKMFGGFPISPFLEFLYRGHPDELTSTLCWLKSL